VNAVVRASVPTSWLTASIVIAAAVLAGCTWQQAYDSAQGWQRNACYRIIEQTERDRCLAGTGMSYEQYRRRGDTTTKE
jgi:uncharacterized membrane protein